MADLIDRNFVLSEIEEEIEAGHGNPEDELINKGLRIARKRVALAPAAEAEPVRHGRWETWGYVFHGIEWKRCSRCGKCADVSYYGLLDGQIRMSTPAICDGCGARMDATDTNVGGKGGADNA